MLSPIKKNTREKLLKKLLEAINVKYFGMTSLSFSCKIATLTFAFNKSLEYVPVNWKGLHV